MDFQSVPPGRKYGGDPLPNSLGEVVLTEGGIRMSVENFFNTGEDFTGFVRAEIGGMFEDAFPTTPLEIDSISTAFDLTTDLTFDVTHASLEYIEFGIHYNFAVNGGPIYEVTTLNDLPVNVAPGVTLALEELDASTHRTRLTLTGNVNSFLIGADELAIDTVVAVPEPASLILLGVGGVLVLRRLRPNEIVCRKSPRRQRACRRLPD